MGFGNDAGPRPKLYVFLAFWVCVCVRARSEHTTYTLIVSSPWKRKLADGRNRHTQKNTFSKPASTSIRE